MMQARRLWTAALVTMLGGFALSAHPQQMITVDASEPRQTMEGWGLSLSWFGNGAGGWSDGERERVAKALFDRQTGLGLNWIRYTIGGGDNPSFPKQIRRPENAVPGFLTKSGEYDWSQDERQRWMMLRAQAMGADLFEAISFSPPYWMTLSGTSQGAEDGGSNMQQRYFGQAKGSFVDYLAEVVDHYAKDWGITFRNVDPLNEPIPLWWKAGDQKQEGCHFSQAEQDRLISDMGAVLARRGSVTTIAAPDENNIDNTVKEVRGYSRAALSRITQINTHSYAGSERQQLRDLAAADGMRLTMSEWGSSPDISGKDLATQIEADVAEMGAVDWAIWQPDWPAIMRVDFKKGSFTLTPMYWVYAAYTRFIKPGYQIMPTHDGSTLAAYSAREKTLVLVEQNWTQQDAAVTFNLSGFHGDRVVVRSYRAHGAESLEDLGEHALTGSMLPVVAPAGSVTTYVVSGVSTYAAYVAGLARAPQPAVLDSTARNEAAKVSFDGRQAEVFGSFAPDAGMAAVSVDGGAETYVDLYAAQKADGVAFYSTPLLAPGKHTLEVRVSGLKAFRSTGTRVTVSRVAVLAPSVSVDGRVTGKGLNAFDFTGHWVGGGDGEGTRASSTADDALTVRFRGRAARFVTAIGPDLGLATVSVDDLPGTAVDLYAAKPQHNGLLYETPLLPPGEHTLRLRVLGRHNSQSSGSTVPSGRVEILP